LQKKIQKAKDFSAKLETLSKEKEAENQRVMVLQSKISEVENQLRSKLIDTENQFSKKLNEKDIEIQYNKNLLSDKENEIKDITKKFTASLDAKENENKQLRLNLENEKSDTLKKIQELQELKNTINKTTEQRNKFETDFNAVLKGNDENNAELLKELTQLQSKEAQMLKSIEELQQTEKSSSISFS